MFSLLGVWYWPGVCSYACPLLPYGLCYAHVQYEGGICYAESGSDSGYITTRKTWMEMPADEKAQYVKLEVRQQEREIKCNILPFSYDLYLERI
eukprot:3291791-Rhodomonas_salina.1